MQFVCPAHLEMPPDKEYRLFIGDQTVQDCGAPCRKMFFTDTQLGMDTEIVEIELSAVYSVPVHGLYVCTVQVPWYGYK
jgi:hypothetical protein